MGASSLEYRFRWALHAVLFGLGFWAPWTFYTATFGSRETLWNVGMSELARTHALNFDSAAVLLLSLGIALPLAALSYRFVEQPFIRLGKQFSAGMPRREVVRAGA